MFNNIIILILSFLMFCSCTSVSTYIPGGQNVPLIQNKNDFYINASSYISTGAGVDVQLSKGLSDRFSIMFNGNYINSVTSGSILDFDKYDYKFKHKYIETGFGYYDLSSNNIIEELYFGVGTGFTKSIKLNNTDEYLLNRGYYNRLFFQINAGKKYKFMEAALSTRLSYVYFYDYDNFKNQSVINKNKNDWDVFIEPAVTLKCGFKIFKLFLQYGLSLPTDHRKYFKHDVFYSNFGAQIKLY